MPDTEESPDAGVTSLGPYAGFKSVAVSMQTEDTFPIQGQIPARVSISLPLIPELRIQPRPASGLLAWLLMTVVLAIAAVAALVNLSRAGIWVTVAVDGYRETVRTTRTRVGDLLTDLGLELRPEDRVWPALDTPLSAGLAIAVQRARPALIGLDGTLMTVYSHANTVGALLADAGVSLLPQDEIWLDGTLVGLETPLPPATDEFSPSHVATQHSWSARVSRPLRLSVRRAVQITVDDGSVPYTLLTTAATVGEALLREQLTLYLGDRVRPGLGSPVRAGMRVVIERSTPVLVTADGRTIQTRTRGKTVGDALVDLGIMVTGRDRVTPALTEPIYDNIHITVVRVSELVLVESQAIPFESILVPDDELELDRQRLDQAGKDGEFRRRFRVIYEDGQEVSRTLIDEWVAAEPITQVVAYGRKIVSRTLETPEGTFTYWRKIRMLATSYSAATAGVPTDAPYYGRTRLGWPMRKGIVAVDPSVIKLGSKVYVPGYGLGDAADTGEAIRARRIDLGYNDDDLELWYRWVDVYLLDPPPPPWEIRWVLPNWPREK